MSDLPPLNYRLARVVVRFGGNANDLARAVGCCETYAHTIARRAGVRFGSFPGVGAIRA